MKKNKKDSYIIIKGFVNLIICLLAVVFAKTTVDTARENNILATQIQEKNKQLEEKDEIIITLVNDSNKLIENQKQEYYDNVNKVLKLIEPFKEVDNKKWFECYKEVTSKLDEPTDNIYDFFSEEELELLYRVVEAEIGGGDFKAKCNVVSVIFNRLDSEKYGNDLKSILTEDQFETIQNKKIHSVYVSDETILACEYVYTIGYTNNCIAFRSGAKPSKWGNWEYQFSDSANHHFYK